MAASGSGWESLLVFSQPPISSAHSSSLISPMPRRSQTQPGESVSKPTSAARDRNDGRTPSCLSFARLHQWHMQRSLSRQVESLLTSISSKVKPNPAGLSAGGAFGGTFFFGGI